MADKQNPSPRRTIRSFVVRSGRMTVAQKAGFDHFSRYGCLVSDKLAGLKSAFSHADRPLVCEIGFGMGGALLEQAQRFPAVNYVGIEVHPPGVGHILAGIHAAGINNLRVYQHCALETIAQCVPDASLDKVQLFFPDPWPKKRHHKRRIVQAELIALLARKVKPGGIWHLATDWAPYVEWMQAHIAQNSAWSTEVVDIDSTAYLYDRGQTRFEARGQRLGHDIVDLFYRRVSI